MRIGLARGTMFNREMIHQGMETPVLKTLRQSNPGATRLRNSAEEFPDSVSYSKQFVNRFFHLRKKAVENPAIPYRAFVHPMAAHRTDP